MTTDHEMRMEALRLYEENEKLRDILKAVDHTLTVHGHIDCQTPLHKRISNALFVLDLNTRAGAEPATRQADHGRAAVGRTGDSISPTGAALSPERKS